MRQHAFDTIIAETKQSFHLSWPLTLSFLMQELTPFVSVLMIGRLGEDALAARVLSWSVYVIFSVWFAGVCGSVSALVAQKFGAQDREGLGLVVSQGFILGFILAFIVMILLWFAPYLFHLSKQGPEVLRLSTQYLHVLMLCVIPVSFLVVIEQFLIGINKTRLVLLTSVVQIPVEIFANYCFVFGKLGLPKFGMVGIGYGSALVFVLSSIILIFVLLKAKDISIYPIFSYLTKIKLQTLKELLRIGFPLGNTYVIEIGALTATTFLIAQYSSIQLAAHQIVWQICSVTDGVLFAISQVTTAQVGQAVGRKDLSAIKASTYANMGLGFCFLLFVSVLYLGFPKAIVLFDIGSHAGNYQPLLHYAVIFLAIALISQIFDNFRLNVQGALRGLKDTRIPMFISIISFWVIGLSLGYLLAFVFHLEGAGLWIGLTLGLLFNTIALMWRFSKIVVKVQ